MKNKALNFSYHSFRHTDVVPEVATFIKKVMNTSTSVQQQELLDTIEQHRIEHGVAIGYLQNEEGVPIAVAGLHYLADAELYEVICETLPGHSNYKTNALSFVIAHAFHTLGIDKICARTSDVFMMNILKDIGFSYCGERAFTEDGRSYIWNYFELENENLAADMQGQFFHSDSNWENNF